MNGYKYSLKLSLYFKRYTMTLSMFNFGESTGDLHMIAMFRQQYKIAVLKCCCSFIQNSSQHFYIYPWPVFALQFLVPILAHASNCIYFAVVGTFYLCLLTIHVTFPSLQYVALQYSFGTVIKILVPFQVLIFWLTIFVSNHF